MRGLYINTDGTMKVVDYTDPQLQDLKEAIGGYVEAVPARNVEGKYTLLVDRYARLQWPHPIVNEVACFLACDKIFGPVIITSSVVPIDGIPADEARALGNVIAATLPGRCRWEGA